MAAANLFAAGAFAPAMAADMEAETYSKAPPIEISTAYGWSGLYVGLNGGGGSSHNCFSPSDETAAMASALTGVPLGAADIDLGCHNATGGTIGGQIGYRWQLGAWVFGVEGQGNWANFRARHDPGTGTPLADIGTIGSKTAAFGLFTGQIGHASGNTLVYVKGGLAAVNNGFDISAGPNAPMAAAVAAAYGITVPFSVSPVGTVVATADDTRWGGTIGAGLEYGLNANWSIGIEYDHIFLSRRSVDVSVVNYMTFPGAGRVSQDIDIGLIRLNYRFGGPVVARY